MILVAWAREGTLPVNPAPQTPIFPPYEAVRDLEIFTVFEAAIFLPITPKKLKRLPIRKVRLGHRTVRYLRKDLLAFMEGHAL